MDGDTTLILVSSQYSMHLLYAGKQASSSSVPKGNPKRDMKEGGDGFSSYLTEVECADTAVKSAVVPGQSLNFSSVPEDHLLLLNTEEGITDISKAGGICYKSHLNNQIYDLSVWQRSDRIGNESEPNLESKHMGRKEMLGKGNLLGKVKSLKAKICKDGTRDSVGGSDNIKEGSFMEKQAVLDKGKLDKGRWKPP